MHPSLLLIVGAVMGAALALSAVVSAMRTRMIVTRTSRRTFEDTCAAAERVVAEAEGWGMPIEGRDMHAVLTRHGLAPENLKRFSVYFVCNPSLAARMLTLNPAMAGMMPCTWAVCEHADGRVTLSKMNVGLMSRVFGGAIGGIMKKVSDADEVFLADVLG